MDNGISVYFLCCSVNESICLVCCAFDSVYYLFGVTIRNIFLLWLLLNVMEVMIVGGGALLDRLCMVFQPMCVCCACDPSVHLDVLSIAFIMSVYVGSNLLI